MSKAATSEREVPEETVRCRSQYATTLHRADPDAEDPEPACECRGSEREFTTVPTAAYRPHYTLCGNPECFGGERA